MRAENLLDTYRLAKQNDSRFLAATAQYNAAKEAHPKAWSVVLPQINLSGNYTQYNQTQVYPGVTYDEPYNSSAYTVTLTQTLYNKQQFEQISQADAQVAQAEAQFNNAKLDLILRTAVAYFNVLGNQDELIFRKANTKAIEQQLQQTKQRFEVGLTAITDVQEAQARYDASVAQEIVAQNQFAVSQELLREITHQPPGALATLKEDSPLLAPDPADVNQWVKTAMDRNLQIIAAQKAVDISQLGIEVAKSGHYPTLNLQASYTDLLATSGINPYVKGATVGVFLNLPLYSGGGVVATTREAAALHQQSIDQYEQQRRATERGTRNSYLTVLSDISTVKALKQALRSSQTALEATQAGFEVGTRTAVDVLNSQQLKFLAESNYAKARYEYILQTLRLKQVSGILTEQDVININNWLN